MYLGLIYLAILFLSNSTKREVEWAKSVTGIPALLVRTLPDTSITTSSCSLLYSLTTCTENFFWDYSHKQDNSESCLVNMLTKTNILNFKFNILLSLVVWLSLLLVANPFVYSYTCHVKNMKHKYCHFPTI